MRASAGAGTVWIQTGNADGGDPITIVTDRDGRMRMIQASLRPRPGMAAASFSIDMARLTRAR